MSQPHHRAATHPDSPLPRQPGSPAASHPVSVRRATAQDAEELIRLRQVMFDSLAPGADPAWQRNAVADLRERLADPNGNLAVFVVDRPPGTCAGGGPGACASAGLGTDPSEDRAGAGPALAACAAGTVERRFPGPDAPQGLVGHIFNVVTDPDMRRRGYSRACMTSLLDFYRERSVCKIDLHASAEGEPLYAALGFRRKSDPAMRLTY